MADLPSPSVVVVQVLAVVGIAAALLLYLFRFKRTRLDIGNKTIFVTSCDNVRGSSVPSVGWECARRLDTIGFRVFAGFVNSDSEMATKLKESASGRLHVVQFDPASCEKMEKAVEYIHQHLPTDEEGLWGLVNTTSECIAGLLEKLNWEQCERQLHINLVAAIRVTKAFLPMLKKRKGRMVSLVSLGGQPCYPGFAVYASCKAGIEGFYEALRYEMQHYDVRFIVVSPTIQYHFETRQHKEQLLKPDETEQLDSIQVEDGVAAPRSPSPSVSSSSPKVTFQEALDTQEPKKPDSGQSVIVKRKFGDDPKLCVLDVLTRQAVLEDVEDAMLSLYPLPQYTSAPASRNNKFRNVAKNCLPESWKRQRLVKDFHSNFIGEQQV